MASKSTQERMKHVQRLVDKYAQLRKELKAAGDHAKLNVSPDATSAQISEAFKQRSAEYAPAMYQKYGAGAIALSQELHDVISAAASRLGVADATACRHAPDGRAATATTKLGSAGLSAAHVS